MLTRYPDWQTRLHAYLLSSLTNPFEYGRFDCCLFVSDAVLAMTGTDLAAPFRGKYASPEEAVARLREYTGVKGFSFAIKKLLHELSEIPIFSAQRGDVVLVQQAHCRYQQAHCRYSLGLIGLNGKEILHVTEQGCLRVPLRRATCAWRV